MHTQILIVDDDAAIRESMREFIEMAGYEAHTAASAEEALESLKTQMVQLLITDIMLPGMNGLELTDAVKKQYGADIIVMTGYSGDYSYEEAIGKGASDFVFKPVRFEELLLRIKRVLNERQLTEERNHMLEKLQKLAITDALTKLYNSRHFYNQLELEVTRCNRYSHPLSLLLLDIDLFKKYNDTYGHLEGDKVLIRIGKIINSLLRKMDSAYRYGGEEFTIILPETNTAEAFTVAQRIRLAIEEEEFEPLPGKTVTITISVGATQYSPPEDLPSLIQRADKSMYMSKQAGRNRVTSLSSEKIAS
jgi:diguanylate cyclase (GGDEF)-like protein